MEIKRIRLGSSVHLPVRCTVYANSLEEGVAEPRRIPRGPSRLSIASGISNNASSLPEEGRFGPRANKGHIRVAE